MHVDISGDCCGEGSALFTCDMCVESEDIIQPATLNPVNGKRRRAQVREVKASFELNHSHDLDGLVAFIMEHKDHKVEL